MGRSVGRSFSFDFAGPLPAVWAAMADTARYNAASGLPKHVVTEVLAAGRQHTLHRPGQGRPIHRSNGRTCRATGSASAGSSIADASRAARLKRARCALRPDGRQLRLPGELPARGGATRPARPVWCSPGGFMDSAARMFDRLAAAGRPVRAGRRRPSRSWPPSSPVTAPARQRSDDRWPDSSPPAPTATAWPSASPPRLPTGWRSTSSASGRWRWRAVGRVPERHAIEACLEATRLGMLELRWDLLCPRCRGAKATQLQPRPAADRRTLRHLQHRLWSRFFAQRRADLAPGRQRSARSMRASSACSGR